MVMTAGSTDLRKVAEASGGGVPQAKLRKYASEMGSITRWVSVYLGWNHVGASLVLRAEIMEMRVVHQPLLWVVACAVVWR